VEQSESPSSAIAKEYGMPRGQFKIILEKNSEPAGELQEHMKV
jgi:hypothetical protein